MSFRTWQFQTALSHPKYIYPSLIEPIYCFRLFTVPQIATKTCSCWKCLCAHLGVCNTVRSCLSLLVCAQISGEKCQLSSMQNGVGLVRCIVCTRMAVYKVATVCDWRTSLLQYDSSGTFECTKHKTEISIIFHSVLPNFVP